MTLSKQLQNLVKGSAVIKTPKQALEALFESVFGTLPKQSTFMKAFPDGYLRCNPEFAVRSFYSHRDLENLKDCANTYLMMILEAEPFEDVLGGEYDQYLGYDLGQFFTPTDVASLLGEISAVTVKMKRKIDNHETFSLSDLCCGGGALTMGILRTLYQEHGKRAISLVDIHAVDIDPHMCRLTALQVILSSMIHQVPFSSLTVECGNPLINKEKLFAYAIPNITSYFRNHEPNELDWYEYNRQLELQKKVA
jgi:hypothetical protein